MTTSNLILAVSLLCFVIGACIYLAWTANLPPKDLNWENWEDEKRRRRKEAKRRRWGRS